jgi:hypothetical protein
MRQSDLLSPEQSATREDSDDRAAISSDQLIQGQSFVKQSINYSDAQLALRDIAETNLHCALGLPGAENLDIPACLNKLDYWARIVRQNTEKWRPKFLKSPEKYEHSYAQFCMMALATVLQIKLGVKYNLSFSEGDYNGTDSRNLFIHGLLSGHGGTCMTMPVLYIAIGRRLGYPLKLVEAYAHSFVRWDDLNGERFNIETTTWGYTSHDDEYYKTWPNPLSKELLSTGVFLRSLSPREELGFFLNARGTCLRENLQIHLALESLYFASLLYPKHGNIISNRAVTTMMQLILSDMKKHNRMQAHINLDISSPKDEWKRWAIDKADKELRRIFRIHDEKIKMQQRENML